MFGPNCSNDNYTTRWLSPTCRRSCRAQTVLFFPGALSSFQYFCSYSWICFFFFFLFFDSHSQGSAACVIFRCEMKVNLETNWFSSTAAFRVEPYNIKMYASQWLKGVITGWFDCLGVPHLFSDLSYHCKHKLIITLLMFFNFVLFFVQWDNCNLFCTWTSALNSGVVSYVENQRTITSTANARCLSFWAL